jgi:hypothetical protein
MDENKGSQMFKYLKNIKNLIHRSSHGFPKVRFIHSLPPRMNEGKISSIKFNSEPNISPRSIKKEFIFSTL